MVHRFNVLSFLLVAAFALAACGGSLPALPGAAKAPDANASVVVFTGRVEAIGGAEWIVNGQTVALDPQVLLQPGLAVGDEVRVQASVAADGSVAAVKVESAARPAAVGASTRPDPVSTTSAAVILASQVSSAFDAGPAQAPSSAPGQIVGVLEAVTADSLTVNGVTYSLAGAQIKDVLGAGDRVRLHVTVHADGTLTIDQAEKLAGSPASSTSGPDDGLAHDSDDDHSDHDSGHDDHDHDEHGSSGHD